MSSSFRIDNKIIYLICHCIYINQSLKKFRNAGKPSDIWTGVMKLTDSFLS